ncbi:MAG: hypothetical protein ABJE10_24520 [bacterium]
MRLSFAFIPALLFIGGCAPTNTPSTDVSPDRVLVVDADGKVLRTAADDRTRVIFPGPKDKVWRALIGSYADAGIEPTLSDAAAGRYGNTAFAVPRRIAGRPIGQFFDCGSSLTGALVDAGRVTALVITTLSSLPDSTTAGSTRVTASLRRNDGSSSDGINCASTGALEELLRASTMKRLSITQ